MEQGEEEERQEWGKAAKEEEEKEEKEKDEEEEWMCVTARLPDLTSVSVGPPKASGWNCAVKIGLEVCMMPWGKDAEMSYPQQVENDTDTTQGV